MLVLSRKPNESIFIGLDIQLTVLSVKGSCVKVGIEAPPHVRILRDELSPYGHDFPPVHGALLEDCAAHAQSMTYVPTLPR